MKNKHEKRIRRHNRIRKKLFGTPAKPRLCVYRGLANLHAQLIDDENQKTILSVSTSTKDFRKKGIYGGNAKAAELLGVMVAEQAKSKGIQEVIFDRAGFVYHGRIKALAEAARKNGLKF
ncbi:MAG: 50S ribosomal protein L18 [Candidatus Omnitrophota bacterium]